jgi:hypothetical protein
MLEIIEKRSEIRIAQHRLMDELDRSVELHDSVKVGYQGGSEMLDISWSEEIGLWWGFKKKQTRYWNVFGTEEPEWSSNKSHNITCEINPSLEGINRRTQGAFAKDDEGKHYVLHRGKIGRVRKALFVEAFRGKWVTVRDGDNFSKLAMVAQLESPRLACQVADFVLQVMRIKELSTDGVRSSPIGGYSFADESSLTRSYSIENQEIKANCDHGIVTNSLAEKLETMGMNVGNTQPVDLFVFDENDEIKILFEVKSSSISSNYYGAIGQLMFHAARLPNRPTLVAVFPEAIDKTAQRVFKELDIECLTYKWVNNEPRFARLSRFRESI